MNFPNSELFTGSKLRDQKRNKEVQARLDQSKARKKVEAVDGACLHNGRTEISKESCYYKSVDRRSVALY